MILSLCYCIHIVFLMFINEEALKINNNLCKPLYIKHFIKNVKRNLNLRIKQCSLLILLAILSTLRICYCVLGRSESCIKCKYILRNIEHMDPRKQLNNDEMKDAVLSYLSFSSKAVISSRALTAVCNLCMSVLMIHITCQQCYMYNRYYL